MTGPIETVIDEDLLQDFYLISAMEAGPISKPWHLPGDPSHFLAPSYHRSPSSVSNTSNNCIDSTPASMLGRKRSCPGDVDKAALGAIGQRRIGKGKAEIDRQVAPLLCGSYSSLTLV